MYWLQAVDEKRKAEDISSVLYPNDATEYGKELRLKQQFFFVSASIQVSLLTLIATSNAALAKFATWYQVLLCFG